MIQKTDIGIIVAMKEEAEIIASSLNLTYEFSKIESINKWTNEDQSIVMLTGGNDKNYHFNKNNLSRVGKVTAGVITTILIEEYKPKVIINCGTAGGIKTKGIKIGDIIAANFVTNHDIRFPSIKAFDGYNSWGQRKITNKFIDRLKSINLPYKVGGITSAESFFSTTQEWQLIHKNESLMKDMEAAAVIQAIEILNYKDPYYIVKSVTDVVDDNISENKTSENFLINFKLAMDNLSDFIKLMLTNKEKLF